MLKGKTILLGVTGGIAAYKAATIVSRLVERGADVHVIMTESATQIITPLTLQTLSRNAVHIDTFNERDPKVVTHIDLADKADLAIVAPASANSIAKLALGLADDMLSTTMLAVTCPVVIAPAMNVHMLEHPAVVQNIATLQSRGVHIIEPGTGQLACGYVARGRLEEPEAIVAYVEQLFARKHLLAGKKVVVTAGGTMERIDPVRYITNDSSGKMGIAIAYAAKQLGADVTLIAGKVSTTIPDELNTVRIESAEDMLNAVLAEFDDADIVIKAAAVADYRPAVVADKKMKKSADELVIQLEKTTDILKTLGERKTTQILVGFAAETHDVEHYAYDKLKRKNCDFLVANDVSVAGAGFNVDTNIVSVFGKEGKIVDFPLLSKQEVAYRLLQLISQQTH
jgi:phosphopantothenoylcysteine decarboxylase / phosphopantothenate---cysteine ligase